MAAAPDDLVIMPYTSGTTGKPKACMHSHRSALFTAVLQARWYRLGRDEVMTGFMPLFHVAGMQGSMNAAIVAGATLVLMARWDKDLIPDLFEARVCCHASISRLTACHTPTGAVSKSRVRWRSSRACCCSTNRRPA